MVKIIAKPMIFGNVGASWLNIIIKNYEEKRGVTFTDEIKRKVSEQLSTILKMRQQYDMKYLMFFDNSAWEVPFITMNSNYNVMSVLDLEYSYIADKIDNCTIFKSQKLEMVKQLYYFTGVHPSSVSVEDLSVMDVFDGNTNVSELVGGFVNGLLKQIKVKNFYEVVKLIAIAHGTGVWENNGEILLKEGIADFEEIIATRDDLYQQLVCSGICVQDAFEITENVRKGKIFVCISDDKNLELKNKWLNEWIPLMIEHSIPEWWIHSCEKIHFLCPKSYALSEMLSIWRLVWYKKYYPIEYDMLQKKM